MASKAAFSVMACVSLTLAACHPGGDRRADAIFLDASDGADWPGYGRTFGEQHFSPLGDINEKTVERLGLAWSIDLPAGNPMSAPVAVNGTLYTSTGYSVVRAIDAQSGKILWTYDPQVPERAGKKLRMNWGSRGLTWWNGRLFVGTADGRLISLDAATGKPVWSVMTVGKDDMRSITGAPRLFDGKVIIGHGGADVGATRGYVTTYDAMTGRQLWRFFTVPGNPADGFENDAMKMAAKTWKGEYWKFGGGGTAWNSFAYDPETRTVFVGTGNGAPWNHRVRSQGEGDNLFLCSLIALDADTGAYRWHYQFNPGETWDYNAAMDIHLATVTTDGKPRKVVMEAPKNGFFYVLDRANGKLISADPIAKITWASGIDLATGRPKENPLARYPNGEDFELWPSPHGAHTWLPSAYNPHNGIMYLPVMNVSFTFNDRGIDLRRWRHSVVGEWSPAANVNYGESKGSYLLAWDPAKRRQVWKVPTPAAWNGGVLTTAGGLVFQGQSAGRFIAYGAGTGRQLWSFDAQVPVLAPPITYRAGGKQYVTVLAGIATTAGISSLGLAMPVDYRTQPRRILTFVLDGKAKLPASTVSSLPTPTFPAGFTADPALAAQGLALYAKRCYSCHGAPFYSGGTAPDLGRSPIPASPESFEQIVREGGFIVNGMPRFGELSDKDLLSLRHFILGQRPLQTKEEARSR